MLDASAASESLFNDGPARQAVVEERLHAPHLIDFEVVSGLRRATSSGRIQPDDASALLQVWRYVSLTGHSAQPLLDRISELRENISAYDAGYVALAEMLGCQLLTADARLSRAPGIRCPVTLLPV